MQDPITKSVVQPAAHVARRYEPLVWLSLFIALILAPSAIRAQIAGTANLQGTVADATGAVISNAGVTLTDETTTVRRETHSDGAGIYIFPNVPTGTYDLTVSSKGFKTYEQKGIVLEVGSSISVNPVMTVGATDVRIEVKSEGLALQTEDATYKQTIDSTQVLEMPLNGRQMTGLLTYTGGVAPASGGDATGSKYSYAAIGISIAGGMANTTLWRLDGADNGDFMAGANLPFPFPDAVNQFSVESSTLGAGDGGHEGGMVNVVTRSGTNQFHGDGFEFIRNNFIDATSFFSNPCINGAHPGPSCGKDTLHYDQYGGTIGGPVRLPKIYDGRDKFFFFAGFQYTRSKQAAANTFAYVPTAANLAGNYTVEAGVPTSAPGTGATTGTAPNPLCNSKLTQLVDPITGAVVPGNVYATPPTPNPASAALLKYLPPIMPLADGSDVCGHVAYTIPSQNFDKQFITREDYTINAKNHLYGRYMLDSYQLPAYFSTTNILETTQSGNPEERVQTGTIGEDHTFTSNLVNSAHIAVLRRLNIRGPNPADINPCTISIAITCGFGYGNLISTGGNNLGGWTSGGGTNAAAHFNDNTLLIDDDVSYLHGKHMIVFGGEYALNQLNISNNYLDNGEFAFGSNYSSYGPYGTSSQSAYNGNYCASCGTQPSQYGSGVLDFLEGAVSQTGFSQSKVQQNAMRGPVPTLYVQDTFHVSRQLTLVAGIRWSPFYMPYDVLNRGNGVFSLSQFIAGVHSTVYPTAPAGMFFYGDSAATTGTVAVPRSFTASSPNQWDPNIGFTYDLMGDGKTVLRGGAEYIYDFPNNFTTERNQQNPPFATTVTQQFNIYTQFNAPYATPTMNGNPYSAGPGAVIANTSVLSNPYPTGSAFGGVPTKGPGCTTNLPPCPTFVSGEQFIVPVAQFHPAVFAQWTVSLQHEFPAGWMASLQYIGSKGNHEAWDYALSPPIFIPGLSSGTAGSANCNVAINGTNYWLGEFPGSAAVPAAGKPCSTTGNEAQRDKLTLINPVQGGLIGGTNNSQLMSAVGISTYEGMVFTVQHRFASNFNVLANYTWSKCLDEFDEQGEESSVYGEINLNPRTDYGSCGFDYRNLLNVTIVARSAFHFDNRLENLALNGWEFGGLSVIHPGSVFNTTVGSDVDEIGNPGGDRGSTIPGQRSYQEVPIRQGSGQANRQFLNPSAFQTSLSYYQAWEPTTANGGTATGPVYGNMSRNQLHGPPLINFDGQISRIWQLHESLNLTTRIEAFNVLNHPSFSTPNATVTSGTFGQVSGTANGARVFQGVLKFIF